MYERFFGIDELPFQLTPDPRYLFLSSKHREALGHLVYGIREGAGFVCITGEIGAGKTTLLRALLREADDTTQYAYILNPVLTGVELLEEINHELGAPSKGTRRELLAALNQVLVDQRALGRRVVLVIDEAQSLDGTILEQLRLLSNFETESAKLLQIVLVGQPELREVLSRPDLEQLNQRITVRWHLGRMDRAETAQYLAHRVRTAGQTRSLFTRGAIAAIHDHSRGTPRLINVAAHRSLMVAYAANSAQVTRGLARRAIAELCRHLPPNTRAGTHPAVWGAAAVAAREILPLGIERLHALLLNTWAHALSFSHDRSSFCSVMAAVEPPELLRLMSRDLERYAAAKSSPRRVGALRRAAIVTSHVNGIDHAPTATALKNAGLLREAGIEAELFAMQELNFTDMPQFLGANPAVVRSGLPALPLAGQRILRDEETLAFELVQSLAAAQRIKAVIAAEAPKDIRAAGTTQPPPEAPVGIRYGELSAQQQQVLRRLIDVYCGAMVPEVAAERLNLAEEAPGGWDAVAFAWAGATEPGIGHSYRVEGPTFSIEFCNVQPDAEGNPANHIHCVWRDRTGDFDLSAMGSPATPPAKR